MLNLTQEQQTKAGLTQSQFEAKVAEFDFIDFLQAQEEHSLATFGPDTRALGIADHITKELLEIEEDPTDLEEWIDVMLLASDGVWRSSKNGILSPVEALNVNHSQMTNPINTINAVGHMISVVLFGEEPGVHSMTSAIRDLLETIKRNHTKADLVTDMYGMIWQVACIGAMTQAPEHNPIHTVIQWMVYKHNRNMNRTWPDWRTAPKDKAIEHTADAS